MASAVHGRAEEATARTVSPEGPFPVPGRCSARATGAALPFFWRSGAQTAHATEASAVTCNPSNVVTVANLDEMDEYARTCGVACTPGDPTSFLPGAAGCTTFTFTYDPPVIGHVNLEQDSFGAGARRHR